MPREREARGSSVIASLASILLLQGFQTMKVVAINCDTAFFPVHAFCGLKSMTTLFFESKSYIVQRGVLVGWFKLEWNPISVVISYNHLQLQTFFSFGNWTARQRPKPNRVRTVKQPFPGIYRVTVIQTKAKTRRECTCETFLLCWEFGYRNMPLCEDKQGEFLVFFSTRGESDRLGQLHEKTKRVCVASWCLWNGLSWGDELAKATETRRQRTKRKLLLFPITIYTPAVPYFANQRREPHQSTRKPQFLYSCAGVRACVRALTADS